MFYLKGEDESYCDIEDYIWEVVKVLCCKVDLDVLERLVWWDELFIMENRLVCCGLCYDWSFIMVFISDSSLRIWVIGEYVVDFGI